MDILWFSFVILHAFCMVYWFRKIHHKTEAFFLALSSAGCIAALKLFSDVINGVQ